MIKVINDKIRYYTAEIEPLSADVIVYEDSGCTYIYDVGACDGALDFLNEITGPVCIVISHFHRDHIYNLSRMNRFVDKTNLEDKIYVSRQTKKYVESGTVVPESSPIELPDGSEVAADVRIFDLPSSHAKGCLAMSIGEEITLLGDGIYPTYREEKKVYNVQKLKTQIEILKGERTKNVFISHDDNPILRREIIIRFLESIYEKREPGEPYITM